MAGCVAGEVEDDELLGEFERVAVGEFAGDRHRLQGQETLREAQDPTAAPVGVLRGPAATVDVGSFGGVGHHRGARVVVYRAHAAHVVEVEVGGEEPAGLVEAVARERVHDPGARSGETGVHETHAVARRHRERGGEATPQGDRDDAVVVHAARRS